MIAYKITNVGNGKSYIGITQFPLEKRWAEHLHHARHDHGNCRAIYAAIRRWGVECFQAESFASAASWDDLCLLEKTLIVQECTRAPHGYNLTAGGDGVRGLRHSAVSRKKMSLAQKKRFECPNEIERLRAQSTGRVVSAETREKMSVVRRGVSGRISEQGRRAISEARKKCKMTAEHIEKLVAARRGKPGPRTGILVSEETRAKMRATAAKRAGMPGNRKGAKLSVQQLEDAAARRAARNQGSAGIAP